MDKQKAIETINTSKGQYTIRELCKLIDEANFTAEDFKKIGLTIGEVDDLRNARLIETNIESNNEYHHLPEKATEVYFWGLPESGKTCLIASLLCEFGSNGYAGGFLS